MGTLADAAAQLSERIRTEGGELRPEFEPAGAPEQTELDGMAEAPAEEVLETGGDAEPEQAVEDDEGGGAEESDDRFVLPDTAAELAEALGIEAGDLYSLKLNIDVGDNESQTFTLQELKDRVKVPIRDEADRNRWLDQKRAQEAELQAQQQALEERRRDADTLATVVMGQLNAQEQQVTEAYQGLLRNVEFQTRDPNAYQVELMRTNAALEDVRRQKQGLMAQMDAVRQQMDAERQQAMETARATGVKRLQEMIPEWADADRFSSGAATLAEYVKQERFGTTDEELRLTLDPRVFYWAEMARRYEALQAEAKEKPKVQPTAKLRPGAPKVRLPRGKRAEIEAMDRLKKSGSVSDAQAVLRQRLKQTG